MPNPIHIPRHRSHARGGAMLEIILGILLSMVVLMGAMQYMAQIQTDIRSKNVAEQMQAFQQAASQYYLANSDAMLAAMADGTGAASYCNIKADITLGTGGTQANDPTLHTCAFDANWLIYKGVLPTSFRATNTFGQRLVAIFRGIYDASNTATGDAEMLAVGMQDTGAQAAPTYAEMAATAEILGGNGGVVPDKDRVTCKSVRSSSTYQVCGTQGGWQVDLSKFISPAQLTTFANSLPN